MHESIVPFVFSWLVVGGPADAVRVIEDIDYFEGVEYAEGKDHLDLYLPEGVTDFPVLVFFHGGGLRGGDKSGSAHIGQALASAGIGVAIANYRLSPNVMHPEHARDAARSVAWVLRNIDEHGGNPARVFVAGHSAGAYLAALLTLDPRYLSAEGASPGKLAGSVPISGFFYVDAVAPDRPKDVWGEDLETWKDASAAKYVRADSPPMLFLYADGDDPWRRRQNEQIVDELRAEGHRDVRAQKVLGRDHTGIHNQIDEGEATFEQIVAFVRAH